MMGVHYCFTVDGPGVSGWMDADTPVVFLAAGHEYGYDFILREMGGDREAANEAVCGLAILEISDGRLK